MITELWLCITCLKKTAVGYFPRNHRWQLLKWKCTLYPWWVIHYLLEQRQVFTDEYHYRLICPGDAIKKRANSCLFKQYVLGFVQHSVKVFSQPSFAAKYFASKVQDFLVVKTLALYIDMAGKSMIYFLADKGHVFYSVILKKQLKNQKFLEQSAQNLVH